MAILTPGMWRQIRVRWEAGEAIAALAREFGVTATTVANHKKKEHWSREAPAPVKPGRIENHVVSFDEPASSTVSTLIAEFGDQIYDATSDFDLTEQRDLSEAAKHIAELEEQIKALNEQVEDYRPTREVAVYNTIDDVFEIMGDDWLMERSEMRLAEINKTRMKNGQFPLDWREQPELVDRTKREIALELIARKSKFAEENQLRVVKMWLNGSIRQVPHELQLNNEAGQRGAAIWKMRDKGAKLVMPYFCQRNNCWATAVVDAQGEFVFDGYCSAAHRSTDPYLGGNQVAGVSTSARAGIPKVGDLRMSAATAPRS